MKNKEASRNNLHDILQIDIKEKKKHFRTNVCVILRRTNTIIREIMTMKPCRKSIFKQVSYPNPQLEMKIKNYRWRLGIRDENNISLDKVDII